MENVNEIAPSDDDEFEIAPSDDDECESALEQDELRAAVRALDLSKTVYDEIAAIKAGKMNRLALLDVLKAKGVSKLGHRMKLASIIEGTAQASATQNVQVPGSGLAQTAEASKVAAPSLAANKSSVGSAPSLSHPTAPAAAASVAAATLASLLTSSGGAWFEVIPSVSKVRTAPSLTAEVIDFKRQRQVFQAAGEQHGWVRLAERMHGRVGWMLIDGTSLGLGPLLKLVPASARLRDDQWADDGLEGRPPMESDVVDPPLQKGWDFSAALQDERLPGNLAVLGKASPRRPGPQQQPLPSTITDEVADAWADEIS